MSQIKKFNHVLTKFQIASPINFKSSIKVPIIFLAVLYNI